jgi:hypothetical protein
MMRLALTHLLYVEMEHAVTSGDVEQASYLASLAEKSASGSTQEDWDRMQQWMSGVPAPDASYANVGV